MKIQTIIVFLIFNFAKHTLLSQNNEVIVKYYPNGQIKEKYSCISQSKLLKNGNYVSYFKLNESLEKSYKQGHINIENYINEKGTYINNQKDGIWVTFSKPFQILDSGNYKLGNKIGIWYHWKNYDGIEVIERYDYDNKDSLLPIVNRVLAYPLYSLANNIQGEVQVSFYQKKDCTIKSLKITKSLDRFCDEEAQKKIQKEYEIYTKYGFTCEEKQTTINLDFKLD